MDIKSTAVGNAIILTLTGNLLGENANTPVLDWIKEQLSSGNSNIAVDMSGVSYVNSTGMGMFIAAQMRVQNAGGKLVLFAVQDNILKLFKLMKIDSTFTIVSGQEEALKNLA